MKKKISTIHVRRKLSRLLSKLEVDFHEHDTEFLTYVNFARMKYGIELIDPYMERYYATWRKERR